MILYNIANIKKKIIIFYLRFVEEARRNDTTNNKRVDMR